MADPFNPDERHVAVGPRYGAQQRARALGWTRHHTGWRRPDGTLVHYLSAAEQFYGLRNVVLHVLGPIDLEMSKTIYVREVMGDLREAADE